LPASCVGERETRQARHLGQAIDEQGKKSHARSGNTSAAPASTARAHQRPGPRSDRGGRPLVPHDILRISGIEAGAEYLVREVQSVYRSQRVDIDDKNMRLYGLSMRARSKSRRWATPGCARLGHRLSSDFARWNERLKDCVKIKDPRFEVEVDKIVTGGVETALPA